ncbi:MAG: DCC1-like thiol-disulfide oxidoreductase family protein [Bacteroidota bacterium]
MKSALKKLTDYWFQPIAPERLAVLRIATGLLSFWYMTTRYDMMVRMVDGPVSMYEPVGLANLFVFPMPVMAFQVLLIGTLLLNVFYILGWKFRYIGPAFGIAFLFLMCYRNSWSMIYHNYNGLVLHILVIGFTAAGQAISLDRVREVGTTWWKSQSKHWQYGWPVVLICAATVITYFLSGFAKLQGDLAWAWASGESMRAQIAVDAIRKEMFATPAEPLFEWLYPQKWLFLGMGILTFVLELGAPLALLNRKIAYVWVALTLMMHWGIFFLMGITFPYHLTGLVFLSFLPVENWWQKLTQKLSDTDKPTVPASAANPSVILFDGVCNFCDAAVKFVIDRDPNGHFQFASLQSEKGKDLLKKYRLPSDLSTIVLVENEHVYTRSSAVLRIAGELNFPWTIGRWLLIIPKPLRDWAYGIFARNRYTWFGQQDSCSIPDLSVRQRFIG